MIGIVDRLRFDATRCELQFSKGVAGNINEAADEIARLRAALLNIQALAERGNPIDTTKLAEQCRHALGQGAPE